MGLADGAAHGMMAPAVPFDLASPPVDFFDNPWGYYAQLREIGVASDGRDGILIGRYADLSAVYRDTATFRSDKRAEFAPKFGNGPLYQHHTTSMVFNDEPGHDRVRRRIVGALSPRAIARLGESLARTCDDLAIRFARNGGGDALSEFAAVIPVQVIGDLLAIPVEDRAPLRAWSLAILGALEPDLTAAQRAAGNRAVAEFTAYLQVLISARRAALGDPTTDLLTRLLAEEDAPLTPDELIHNVIFLLNAGHETTTNLIASALFILAGDDTALAGHSTSTFVEEVLRYESPNQLGSRAAACDTTIGGVAIRAGCRITLVIGAANRDHAVFSDPERFDPARTPNRHLAFGAGSHQCAGLSLARLEAQLALDAWRRHIPRCRLASPPQRQRRVRFRGFDRLEIAL